MHAVIADWSGFEKSVSTVSTIKAGPQTLPVQESTYGGAADVALALEMGISVSVFARTGYRALSTHISHKNGSSSIFFLTNRLYEVRGSIPARFDI
jgi:hypothetical protein